MRHEARQIDQEHLAPSVTDPERIAAGTLAVIEPYVVRYVTWRPGTCYPDHRHLDDEHILLLKGELLDGARQYQGRCILTYPAGSRHNRLRTDAGAEFVLFRTSRERMVPVSEPAGDDWCGPVYHALQPQNLRKSQRHAGISAKLLAQIGSYLVEWVKWETATSYTDHEHLDTETIFLVSGDLADGGRRYAVPTVLSFSPGSRHQDLRTETGAEFLLIWTGHERVIENALGQTTAAGV